MHIHQPNAAAPAADRHTSRFFLKNIKNTPLFVQLARDRRENLAASLTTCIYLCPNKPELRVQGNLTAALKNIWRVIFKLFTPWKEKLSAKKTLCHNSPANLTAELKVRVKVILLMNPTCGKSLFFPLSISLNHFERTRHVGAWTGTQEGGDIQKVALRLSADSIISRMNRKAGTPPICTLTRHFVCHTSSGESG